MRTAATFLVLVLAPAAAAGDCRDCHQDAHPGFEKTGHALAAVEPWYERSLAASPAELRPLCAKCHSPEPERPLAGVTCAACHVRSGIVLVGRDPAARRLEAPHPVRFAPELRDGRLCASCHAVDLPLGPRGAPVRLQDTVAEHGLWRERTGDRRSCVDCHVAPGKPHFAGVRDPGFLAGAIRLAIVRRPAAAGEVAGDLVLENRTGHAFPTGSRLREAWVRLALVGARGERREVLVRSLAVRGDEAAGETLSDERLGPGETLRLPFRAPLPAGFAAQGGALECRVELALVSLYFPNDHPLVPGGEERVLPVAAARIELSMEAR